MVLTFWLFFCRLSSQKDVSHMEIHLKEKVQVHSHELEVVEFSTF